MKMANWRHKLKIKDIIENDESIENKKIEMAKRIKLFSKTWSEDNPIRMELEDIADNFEAVENNITEFDGCLEELYNWGDQQVRKLPTDIQGIDSKMCFME